MGLLYKVILPPLTAPDVVVRSLEIVTNGNKNIVGISPVDLEEYELPPLNKGDVVSLRVSDIDARQNAYLWTDAVVFVAANSLNSSPTDALSVVALTEPETSKVNVVKGDAVVKPPPPETPADN